MFITTRTEWYSCQDYYDGTSQIRWQPHMTGAGRDLGHSLVSRGPRGSCGPGHGRSSPGPVLGSCLCVCPLRQTEPNHWVCTWLSEAWGIVNRDLFWNRAVITLSQNWSHKKKKPYKIRKSVIQFSTRKLKLEHGSIWHCKTKQNKTRQIWSSNSSKTIWKRYREAMWVCFRTVPGSHVAAR